MANWSLPSVGNLYVDYTSYIDARLNDLVYGLDPTVTTVTNPKLNSVRWSSSSNRWEKYNGSGWAVLSGQYDINVTSATRLTTARNLSITGDGTASAVSFDGSANAQLNFTLANVNSNVGTFGSASAVPVFTVNAKGQITGVSTAALGSIATQNANSVSITGGGISGTNLTLVQSTTAAPTVDGRVEWDNDSDTLMIGNGTVTKVFSPDDVAATLLNKDLVGGSINNVPIGATTRAAGNFTTLTATGKLNVSSAVAGDTAATIYNSSGTGYGVLVQGGGAGRYIASFKDSAGTEYAQVNTSGLSVSGDVQLNNAQYFKSKNVAGTTTRMLGVNGSNIAYVGSIDTSDVTQLNVNLSGVDRAIFSSTGLSVNGNITGTSELQLNATNSAIRFQTSGANKWAFINDFPSAGILTLHDHENSVNRFQFSSAGLSVTGQVLGKSASSVDANAAFESNSGASGITAYHAQNNGGYGCFFGYDNTTRYPVNGAAVRNIANSPLYFETNNTLRMTLDASGNLGLGVTPSVWGGSGVLELAGGSIISMKGAANFASNGYYNGGWKYTTSTYASFYSQSSGQHQWYTAPSGTAGNLIAFTQAMTLDASGNLDVIGNIRSGAPSTIYTGVASRNFVAEGYSSDTAQYRFILNHSGSGLWGIGSKSGNLIIGKANDRNGTLLGTELLTLNANGNLLVGSASTAVSNTTKTISLNTSNIGNLVFGVTQNSTTMGASSTSADIYTTASLDIRFGTSSTERMRIDASGNLLVGTTSVGSAVATGGAQVYVNAYGTGQTVFDIGHISGTATGTPYQRYFYNGLSVGSVTQNGTTGISLNSAANLQLSAGSATATLDTSGNLTLTTAGARIRGDFSNAAQASRVMFQTSVTNGDTTLGVLPNGSGTATYLAGYSSSAATNCVVGCLVVNNSVVSLNSATVGTGATAVPIQLVTPGGTCTLDTTGNFTASGNVTAYSDERLKENIKRIGGALDLVMQMEGVWFNRKGSKNREVGFIAQQLRKLVPELIVEGCDEMHTLSVAYGNVTAILVEAFKELVAEVRRGA